MGKSVNLSKNIAHFLLDYEKLCKKYQMYIASCGCCSSPWIQTEEMWAGTPNNSLDLEIEENIKHLKSQIPDNLKNL